LVYASAHVSIPFGCPSDRVFVMGMRASVFVLVCLAYTRGGTYVANEKAEADSLGYRKNSNRASIRSPNWRAVKEEEKMGSGFQSETQYPTRSLTAFFLAFIDLPNPCPLRTVACSPGNVRRLQIGPILPRSRVLFMQQATAPKVKPLQQKRMRKVKIRSRSGGGEKKRVKVQGVADRLRTKTRGEEKQVQNLLASDSLVPWSGAVAVKNSLVKSLKAYVAAVTSKQVICSAVLGGAGNVMAQLVDNGANFDDLELLPPLSYILFSTLYCGGFQPNIYRAFDRWFGEDIGRKIVAEFLAYAPLVYIPSFYMITGAFQGLGWSGSLERLSDLYLSTYLSYFLVWPLPMLVYFRWIPTEYRVGYLSLCGFMEKVVYTFVGRKH